ncbi:MAG TPA: AIR synthase-related protein, partial [Hanamia sp.]|nr:AIR synthase-related protein [Hanamia sp.]
EDFNCSEYLHKICGIEYSPAPYFNLDEEFRLHNTVSSLIKNKIILSAHDISEGGLFVTLAESGFQGNLGFAVNKQISQIRNDTYWFGEAQGRVVVSVSADKINEFEKAIDIPIEKLGTVTSGEIKIDVEDWGDIKEWKRKYDESIEGYLKRE